MWRPRIFRWRDIDSTQGLLFVAQRIEEALFDYTLDTYKAPSLNTHSRCIELSRAIGDVRARVLLEKNLIPIVEELAWSVSNDVAARNILGPLARRYSDLRHWSINDLDGLRTQTELLRAHLRSRQYERQLSREIETRLSDSQRKQELSALCTDLIVEWINRGFSRDYIFYKTRTFFFSPSGSEIDSNDRWGDFLKEFDHAPRKFEVVFRIKRSPLLSLFSEIGSLQEDLQARTMAPKEQRFLERAQDETFLRFTKIEQLDARSAVKRARTYIESAQRFIIYHSHKDTLDVHPDTLVYDSDAAVVLKQSASAVHKERDCTEGSFPRTLQRMATAFFGRSLDRDSQRRIRAALALHASAVSSADATVQLTSMWAALEALLPTFDDQAKISVIADNLCPALSRYYPLRLLSQLEADLRLCIPMEYDAVSGRLGARVADALRCAAIVAIPANEPLRDELYGALHSNPLLKFRMYQIMRATTSSDSLLKLISAHAMRVNWHIRRIYRSRNLLVHGGRRLPYLEGLVENIHSYFHKLMDSLMDVCSRRNIPGDLDAVFLAIRLEAESHLEYLGTARQTTGEECLIDSLCGPILAAECKRSGEGNANAVEDIVSRWRVPAREE